MEHKKDRNNHPTPNVSAQCQTTKDYSAIGYYGRSIMDLSRDELLEAIAELAELYIENLKKTGNAGKY